MNELLSKNTSSVAFVVHDYNNHIYEKEREKVFPQNLVSSGNAPNFVEFVGVKSISTMMVSVAHIFCLKLDLITQNFETN